MIKANTAMTNLFGAESIGGGLYPAELAERQKRVKKGGKICKGQGCITRISAYNRNYRGHLETLCYKCRSKTGYPTRKYAYKEEEDKKQGYTCKNGHKIAEVGRRDNGGCCQCAKDRAKARYERTLANRADPNHVRKDSRLALWGLASLIEGRGVSLKALERKTGIPAATLGGYAKVVGPIGYKCRPNRAKMIADYFRVSVAELTGETEPKLGRRQGERDTRGCQVQCKNTPRAR